MPYKPVADEEVGPTGGHFALLVDASGKRMAIRPGASLWLVEDKSQMDKIYPLVLKKVAMKKLVFQMQQADGSVVDYEYTLTTAKPNSKAAMHRMLKNRGDMDMPKVQK